MILHYIRWQNQHELKHAMQEAEGRDAEMSPEEMEDEAEDFGMKNMY